MKLSNSQLVKKGRNNFSSSLFECLFLVFFYDYLQPNVKEFLRPEKHFHMNKRFHA